MTVLIIENSSIPSNNGRHYTNALNGLFIEELIALGNEVVYFQFESATSYSISSFELEEHGVYGLYSSYGRCKLFRYLRAYTLAIKAILSARFVYLYYPNSFKYIALFCKVFKRPYGIYIRGMNNLNDSISRGIYRNASAILTVSDYFTAMVNRIVNKDLAQTIRPMIPYTDEDVIHNRYYESKDKYIILYLGRIAKDKGLEELIFAIERLHQRGYHLKLRIVGNGEYLSELLGLTRDRCLEGIISIEGPVFDKKEKANIYQQSDLYVLPTYHEGFPRTLYEAMIFGTPIITTFVGGIPALMKNTENSLMIEPRSVESIVDALTYAMNNYEDMGRMAKNATEMVAKVVDHNRPTHARQLYDIIKDYGK